MNKIVERLKSDSMLSLGIGMLLVSFTLYVFTQPMYKQTFGDKPLTLFFIHYGLAVVFMFTLLFKRVMRLFRPFKETSTPYAILLLMLFNISAYSLNQMIPVFNESVDWLTDFLIFENLILVLLLILPSVPRYMAGPLLFFCAFFLLFNVYQMIMTFPYYPISTMVFWVLGISMHIFVPVFYIIALFTIIRKLYKQHGQLSFFVAGLLCVFLTIGIYSWQWNKINQSISGIKHQYHMPGKVNELPEWLLLAQNLPEHPLTEEILKSELIYQVSYPDNWMLGGLRFEDKKLHDPLIGIASMFNENINLNQETRLKLLNAYYDSRHETADRFWSGKNLLTSDIISNIQLFPAYRMAYTEMILHIKNEHYQSGSRWFSQQEALYTFQLPEGGTITSLSLWIGGQEAKARLTTKEKAENAYNTIVGREKRDPSVVYWMEGNQIRVRIFPCTPKEERKFKLGITSPLALENDQLIYQNISFKGPDYNDTRASVNLLIENGGSLSANTLGLKPQNGMYSWTGNYQEDWTLRTEALPLSDKSFLYKGHLYSVQELEPEYTPFQPEIIYLDLSRAWNEKELEELLKLFPKKDFQVYNYHTGRMIQLNEQETINWFEQNQQPEFSLFPFHKIRQPENALVITYGGVSTPNLSDLDGSVFKKELFKHLGNKVPVKVFDLEKEASDYVRSLTEFQVVQYAQGSVNTLRTLIENHQFPTTSQKGNAVAIAVSQIKINKTRQQETVTMPVGASNAPDHLLRLFSYNQVMKNIGRNYFNKKYLNESVIKEAELGNVVTPVSSLIVLETLHDYERFKIDENQDALGNAAIKNSGAVPEPHEWALIIAGLLFIAGISYKKFKKMKTINH